MENAKRKAIEASGWKVGDAADFLGMSQEEREQLNARMEQAQAIRHQHEAMPATETVRNDF